VPVVPVVDEDLETELTGDVEGLIGGTVVDENDGADRVLRQLLVRHAERPARIVGWHHDHDFGCAEWRHGVQDFAQGVPTTSVLKDRGLRAILVSATHPGVTRRRCVLTKSVTRTCYALVRDA